MTIARSNTQCLVLPQHLRSLFTSHSGLGKRDEEGWGRGGKGMNMSKHCLREGCFCPIRSQVPEQCFGQRPIEVVPVKGTVILPSSFLLNALEGVSSSIVTQSERWQTCEGEEWNFYLLVMSQLPFSLLIISPLSPYFIPLVVVY